jgi:GNAT superfamily N-acetyltransferase
MPVVDVKVFYLEMRAHAKWSILPPRDGLAVIHAQKPTVAYYRFLYNTVGRDYHWYSRGNRPDAELAGIVQDPLNEVHVLHVDGVPAGFAELDRRIEGEIELVQFGLMPEFIGQGLGKYFLQWIIDKAWSHQPRRFWLHTCTLDHPSALPNYLKAGFTIYKEEITKREV